MPKWDDNGSGTSYQIPNDAIDIHYELCNCFIVHPFQIQPFYIQGDRIVQINESV